MFAERGIVVASVEEICERAGFTRGAFYSNFSDKNELLAELLRREEQRLVERLDEATQEPARSMQDVDGMLERFLRTRPVDREYYLIQTEMALYAIREGRHAPEFTEAHSRFKDRLAVFLDRVLDGLKRDLTIPQDDALDLVLALFERSNRRALLDRDESRLDELTRVAFMPVVVAVSRPRAPS